ncbi:MAG TPA: hypothetical protein VF166_06040 [Gemmatimonadaceae bacterium]
MRTVLGVVLGYALFAVSAVALFRLSGHDPHVSASFAFESFTIAYGILFAGAAGYLATLVVARRDLRAAGMVAGILALVAFVSLVARPGAGAIWTQLSAVVLFAPTVVLGGWCRLRYHARRYKADPGAPRA